ncbi:MAG: bifunctional folylpolyglutamate synthase/dihydrofolate synthase [Clostridia bacterium]|nr:bifunctional folylpolyglutamate synthase/dihydrofolate synthase [Clostridia bacterium]
MKDIFDDYLIGFKQFDKEPSLDGTLYLLKQFGNPEKDLKFIHIAGTNGKGSIAEHLNRALIDSGYKVGKFVTPHLISTNDSICVNDEPIDDETIKDLIKDLKKFEKKYKEEKSKEFTRFELLTASTIKYFKDMNCDIVILEVGLGGLFDCTNVVHPLVSVFGSIAFDHMDILGNSLEEIAYQKAGIIKENSNSVIFDQEAAYVIEKVAKEKSNNLKVIYPNEISDYSFDRNYQYFKYKDLDFKLNLKGKKQVENAVVAFESLQILKNYNYRISNSTILDSFSKIKHPGRFETIKKEPLVIFDGAHNPNAISNLIETINSIFKRDKKRFIVSIIDTKDYKKILDLLLSNFKDSEFFFTSGCKDKFLKANVLLSYAKENYPEVKSFESSIDDISHILDKDSINFIVGSFYTYEHIKKIGI